MAKAKLYSSIGAVIGERELPDAFFDQVVNEAVLYTAVNVYLGNQRQGTHKTQTRSETNGSGHKPWKQKGTGRARAGTNTSSIWVRGHKAHGPKPRDYRRGINKKVKHLALVSAYSMKAKENGIHVFEKFELSAPKTKEFFQVMKKAELANKKNLLVLAQGDENLLKASRNIPGTSVMRVQDVNSYVVLNANNVIFTDEAVKVLAAGA